MDYLAARVADLFKRADKPGPLINPTTNKFQLRQQV